MPETISTPMNAKAATVAAAAFDLENAASEVVAAAERLNEAISDVFPDATAAECQRREAEWLRETEDAELARRQCTRGAVFVLNATRPSEMVFDFMKRFGVLVELATTVAASGREAPISSNVARGISRLYEDLCELHSGVDMWERKHVKPAVESAREA